jgi:hypothetical protein
MRGFAIISKKPFTSPPKYGILFLRAFKTTIKLKEAH